MAGHYVGFPAFCTVIGSFYHRDKILRAACGQRTVRIEGAACIGLYLHAFRIGGFLALQLHAHFGKLVVEGKGNLSCLVVHSLCSFGVEGVCQTVISGLLIQSHVAVGRIPGTDFMGLRVFPINGYISRHRI